MSSFHIIYIQKYIFIYLKERKHYKPCPTSHLILYYHWCQRALLWLRLLQMTQTMPEKTQAVVYITRSAQQCGITVPPGAPHRDQPGSCVAPPLCCGTVLARSDLQRFMKSVWSWRGRIDGGLKAELLSTLKSGTNLMEWSAVLWIAKQY